MRTNAVLGIVKCLSNNRLFALPLVLALFAGGIALSSAGLLIAAGILTYGWPILHIYFKDAPETVEEDERGDLKDTLKTVEKAPAKPLEIMRPKLADAR
ncbi:MAG: hypothetical protein LBQ62_06155 [Candidatus Accumulibacter sp.]|jgi:hypothetical protein|nr:hypothetical protein [Accumulibacter sp.]